METRASYVLIGAFTLGVLVLAFLFVLWIGKLQLDREWDYYDVVFTEAVTGLTVGGAVQYNGIQVGEVRRLSLAKDNPSEVIARVRVSGGTPVKTDTRAKLAFTGLTGVAVIQLSGGSVQAGPLVAANGDGVPRIVAEDSALQKLLTSSEDIVTNVNDLLLRLSVLMRDENLQKVAQFVDHLEKITGAAAGKSEDIAQAIADLGEASHGLRATLSRTEAMVIKLDALAESGQRTLDTDGRETLASARESLDALRRFADTAQALVDENRSSVAGMTHAGAEQLGPTLVELKATLRKLQQIADQLGDDPAVLIRGADTVTEYEPR